MTMKDTIRRSMLWSAYGDALGFITELCDKATLAYRTGGKSCVSELIPWKRKIGGQYGVPWQLPAGCYSDDTQLRLAVCRSIRGGGEFDVEPFAKVELPIFLAYALGAGTGTKTAAESLKKKSVHWNTNFYETKYSKYVDGGGNGAAMRIQPHVWCAKSKASDTEVLRAVLRDTIVTHGHPIALVGAAFHALLLRATMETGQSVPAHSWQDILTRTESIPKVVNADEDLSLLWLPEWERRTGKPFADEIRKAIGEARVDMECLVAMLPQAGTSRDREASYANAVKGLNALDMTCRGSATKTALLAAYVSVLFSEEPAAGITACVNVIGSDTDTIATMAGALLGTVADREPPQHVQDQKYLVHQADRMAAIRDGDASATHNYPDLLSWDPPSSSIDAIGTDGPTLVLRGFGEVRLLGQPTEQKGTYPTIWQECRTLFGQTLIVKRRKAPRKTAKSDLPRKQVGQVEGKTAQITTERAQRQQTNTSQQLDLLDQDKRETERQLTVDEASDAVIKSGFDPATTGRALMSLAVQKDGVEKAIGFAAIVAKAKGYRMRRDQEKRT